MNDTRTPMLAGLVKMAEAQGADLVTLRALVEEATEVGAARALARVGLHDATAGQDVEELRELLSAWRGAKQSAWKGLWQWFVRAVLVATLAGIAARVGLEQWMAAR